MYFSADFRNEYVKKQIQARISYKKNSVKSKNVQGILIYL